MRAPLRRAIAGGNRIVLPTLVLYEWLRGPRIPEEITAQEAVVEAYLEALEGPLAATGRFSEITHVPALMLPPDPSLTRLREVAALMQAGLLLVYSTESHIVTWVSPFLFSRDQVRVLASIDLILLDVRTGVVPYAETFHAEHLERERSKDLSIVETQRRAERKATLLVLGRAAEGLKRFMAP